MSLALSMVKSKVSPTLAPLLSLAVIWMSRLTSLFPGMPLKVRVAGSKLSHDGSGVPSAWVAL